jgi:hypothetical protein
MGLEGVQDSTLALGTWIALFVLWVINVGVHFTNIPLTLRWDHHPRDAKFKALHHPLAILPHAHDPPD